jgi:hypothetical protein
MRGQFLRPEAAVKMIVGWRRGLSTMEAFKMNKQRIITGIAILLMLVVPNSSPAYSRSDNNPAGSRWQRFLTPDEEFIMTFNSAKALPYLASARKDIVRSNISGAQSEVGQALTLIDEMKSRFSGNSA